MRFSLSKRPTQADSPAYPRSLRSPLSDALTDSAFPRSIEFNPSHQFTAPRFPVTCLLTGSAPHTLRKRRDRSAPHPADAPASARMRLYPYRPPQSLSTCSHHALPPPLSTPTGRCAFLLFLAPKYVHISSSAILDEAIDVALPLARLALVALIRSRATSLFSKPTAHRSNVCAHHARRRRYAGAPYAHLNRLPFDTIRERGYSASTVYFRLQSPRL